ncbi:MAG: proline--tRNA ligase [Candidatus Omnitrophica bacterium]|nr:proline--tRNA ligase [Candidatus Omnitrophota bacterium]
MKWSRYFLPTLREDPKDAESISHKLMVRAGLIRRLGSGAYSYLPFGLRALQKAIAIVREEMNRAGAQELLMPVLQPTELWKRTGRYELLGDVLITFKDRTDKEIALGPTHEEVVTDLLKEIRSPKHLPMTVYQIQNKFRDEPRPRGGVIRSKEFLMKDAYSFDADHEGLGRSYDAMAKAYHRIFTRCGLKFLACEADPGMMGGSGSQEFMGPAECGEDRVVKCTTCDYAANLEAATCPPSTFHLPPSTERPQPLQVVKTPGKHSVKEVSEFLKVPSSALIKTLIYDVEKEHVAVLVRGDHDVNEAKLARVLTSAHVKLSDAKTIERLSGAPMGFTGPVKLGGVTLVADHAVMRMVNAVTGANAAEAHMINVNPGRDFTVTTEADLRMVTEADACPKCGGRLRFVKAIEIGHVFKLGTKYSQALGAEFQAADGAVKPMVMGCYGIGVNRILATAIEQGHDAAGIIWPVNLAPFQVVISIMEHDNAEQGKVGEALYEALGKAGLEALLDDRQLSAGVKLKDADLIGIPVQVVIGKVWQAERKVEVVERASKQKVQAEPSQLAATIRQWLDKASSS